MFVRSKTQRCLYAGNGIAPQYAQRNSRKIQYLGDINNYFPHTLYLLLNTKPFRHTAHNNPQCPYRGAPHKGGVGTQAVPLHLTPI